MRISYFCLKVVIGFLLTVFSSVNLMASESIELTGPDINTNLQAFRDDGKFTLVLLRYDGCKPCDEAETSMQQWYDQVDQQIVSALIMNTGETDRPKAVYARQLDAGISITSLFTKNPSGIFDAVNEITGKPFRAVPLFIFFGADGEFIAEALAYRMNWPDLNEAITNR